MNISTRRLLTSITRKIPKAAMQLRNREMVDRSDLVVCYIEHNSGGAFQTVQYAKKKNKEIVNLSDQ